MKTTPKRRMRRKRKRKRMGVQRVRLRQEHLVDDEPMKECCRDLDCLQRQVDRLRLHQRHLQ
jgi:hypothetical protein